MTTTLYRGVARPDGAKVDLLYGAGTHTPRTVGMYLRITYLCRSTEYVHR
jgi:hypothetical protein